MRKYSNTPSKVLRYSFESTTVLLYKYCGRLKGKRTSFYGESARSSYYLSNLSYKVDARLQSFRSFLPLGRADFSIVCGNKLCSFYLAQQLVGIASDVVVLYLGNLDFTLGIYEECAAICHAFLFNHHAECAAQYACGVGKHGVLNLADAFGSIVPCLVHKVRVCAYRIYFYAHCLELVIFLCDVYQLGRAYEGKVCRIEEENGPFTFYVFVGYCFETSVLESLNLEFREL